MKMKSFRLRERFWSWIEKSIDPSWWRLYWLYRFAMRRATKLKEKREFKQVDVKTDADFLRSAVEQKTAQARKSVVETFVRSAVDIKPTDTVEMRDGIAIVKPKMDKARLRQNAKQLRAYKKIWRQTDRSMPWKEFRAEVNKMNSFGNAFCEAHQMVMDRQLERARSFYGGRK